MLSQQCDKTCPLVLDEMEEIKIDTETANLVFQTYQKINTLKRLLNQGPYSKMKGFLESGKVLSEIMNDAIEETTKKGMESKLTSLSTNIKSLASNTDIFQNIRQKQDIITLLEQLQTDVTQLQTKINA